MTMKIGLPAPADSGIDIWERQPGETAKQFHAFCHYRDMAFSERTLDRAWRAHNKACLGRDLGDKRADHWTVWSSQWGWVARVDAWDRNQELERRKALVKEHGDAARRHARMAQGALQVLSVPTRAALEAMQDPTLMAGMIERAKSSPMGMQKLLDMVASAARTMQSLVEVERLSLGMSTALIEVGDEREERVGRKISADPVATDLAIQLLDRMAGTSNGKRAADEVLEEGGANIL